MALDHRRAVLVGGIAFVLAAMVGCADDSRPSTLPDTTRSAAPSPVVTETAEPTPSVDPTAALEAEVEDFIRTYDAALYESWRSDDALARRREMFADDCDICLGGYEIVKDARAKGLTHEGAASEILEVDVLEVDRDSATVLVLADVPAARLVDQAGEVVETFPPNPGIQLVYEIYRHEDAGWIVVRIEAL